MSEECFAWKQQLYMSMERYIMIRGIMEKSMSSTAFMYFFSRIPDGTQAHYFLGTEVEVRKLCKKTAEMWGE